MKRSLFFPILFLPSICHANPTLNRELAFDALMAIDYGQTQAIFHSNGRYRELNPIIHQRSVGKYFLTSALLHAAITYSLPEKWRSKWQWSTIAIECAVVGHNAYIGIGIRW